jgi:hypothetical protein
MLSGRLIRLALLAALVAGIAVAALYHVRAAAATAVKQPEV